MNDWAYEYYLECCNSYKKIKENLERMQKFPECYREEIAYDNGKLFELVSLIKSFEDEKKNLG